jgi:hypothetical protein
MPGGLVPPPGSSLASALCAASVIARSNHLLVKACAGCYPDCAITFGMPPDRGRSGDGCSRFVRLRSFAHRLSPTSARPPHVGPNQIFGKGQLPVQKNERSWMAEHLTKTVERCIERLSACISRRIRPEEVDESRLLHPATPEGHERLEHAQRDDLSLAPRDHGLLVNEERERRARGCAAHTATMGQLTEALTKPIRPK